MNFNEVARVFGKDGSHEMEYSLFIGMVDARNFASEFFGIGVVGHAAQGWDQRHGFRVNENHQTHLEVLRAFFRSFSVSFKPASGRVIGNGATFNQAALDDLIARHPTQ